MMYSMDMKPALLCLVFFITVMMLTMNVGAATVHHMPSAHRYMPGTFLHVDTTHVDRWRPVVTEAAHEALATINAALRSNRDPEEHLQLERVDVTDAQVGRTLSYSGVVEVSHYDDRKPSAYAMTQHVPFSMIQPPKSLSNLWTIPSSLSRDESASRPWTTQVVPLGKAFGSAPSADLPQPDRPPVFPEFEVEGPLVLHLDQLLYDPTMRLPRQVDAGAVHVIKVGSGVRLHVAGVSEMRLKTSLEVASSMRIITDSDDQAAQRTMADRAEAPQIEVKLANHGRDFRLWSSAADRVKVKRKSANVVELLSPTSGETDVPKPMKESTAIAETDGQNELLAKEDRAWVLSHANLVREVARTFEQAMEDHQEGHVVLRRVVEGTAEAVNVMVIPISVKDPLQGGHVSEWQIIVSRGADGKNKLVSHHQVRDIEAELPSVAPSLLHNTTWPALLQAFHAHSHPQAAQ